MYCSSDQREKNPSSLYKNLLGPLTMRPKISIKINDDKVSIEKEATKIIKECKKTRSPLLNVNEREKYF